MTTSEQDRYLESVNASAINLDARQFDNNTSTFYNVATTEDGRVIMAKLVTVDNEGVTVTLGNDTQDYDILLNGYNQYHEGGKSVDFRLEFYEQATGEPIIINSVATFGDIDQEAGTEIVTVDAKDFTSYSVANNTSLIVDTNAEDKLVIAAGTEPNYPTDNDAKVALSFEGRQSIEFSLTTRTINSGFTIDSTPIHEPVSTPLVQGDYAPIVNASALNLDANYFDSDTNTFLNVATTEDGRIVMAKLVTVDNEGATVTLGKKTQDYDILLNEHNQHSEDGKSVDFRLEFYDQATGKPIVINSVATFGDIDQEAGKEILTVDATDYSSYSLASDTSLVVETGLDDKLTIAAGTEPNYPTDNDAKIALRFEARQSIEFSLTSRAVNSGFTIDGTPIHDPVTTPLIPENQAPIAKDDAAMGVEDTKLVIAIADLLANDSDPDGDALLKFSVQDPVNGNVSFVGNTVEFYPDAGYTGPASFTYTITDGKGGFDTATVNLTIEAGVNEAPVVAGEDIDGVEDTAVVTPVADLLANDVDPEGKPLTIVSVQDPVNGVVELVNGEVIFTPDANYNGPASYTYTVSDGENEEKATVNLNIAAVNDDPTAGDDVFEGPFIEGQPIAIDVAKVLENDFDIDGDAVRANAVIDSFGGHFAMVDGVPTFIPDAGFVGDATLTYQITDDKGGVDTATITFKIIANPNQDPVANDDNLGQFLNDAPAPIDVAQILSNDTDADGDTLTPTAVVATENGSFAMINGVPSFIPDAGFVGTASLTYKVEDGKGGSDTATIFFEFVDADQAPQAADDMAEGLSNNDLVIDPADLLANDLDPEGKPLSLVSVGNPVNGTVAIVAGQIIFTPDDGYKGPASFTYVVADPAGNEGSATVNLAINDNAIYGTPNDDIPLNGTENNDYIKGLEGDDTINGLGGDDFIYGGPGKDTINGGDGDDTVLGGYDDDRIEGGKGNDILNGNQGNDTLKGGEGHDTLNGSSGNDLLLGQEGNDKLYGDAGDDTLEGGAGDDLLQGGQENDVLTGGLGADTFLWTGNDIQPHGNGRETDIIRDFNTAEGDKLDLADLLVNEQNSDNLDRYLDFSFDDSTGDTTIAISTLGSFEKSDDAMDCQQMADQLIVLEGVDLTAGNTIADENIIQNMLNNNQLIVDSL